MIDFAASKGWTSSAGEIRAHIDYVERPLPVSRETFCGALRRFASGVSVVAAGEGRNRRGMTVSAFSSVSAEPPTVLVCINAESSSHDSIVSADTFSVNILSGHQRPVALLFAGHTGVQGADRFEEDSWEQGVHGAPVLEGALQSLICAKTAGYRAGTHTILIGRVVEATTAGDGPALVNFNGSLLDMAGALNDEMPCFRKRA
jgi:flavin reductase (DIM6/NTAB) family NADH-FMN oxidoreductase RutF